MAIITYTVTVNGGVASISPDPNEVVLLEGDFAIFQSAAGTVQDIRVKVVDGNEINGSVLIAVRLPASRIAVHAPRVQPDGSVLITFGDEGGGGNLGFPP